jgi:antitoxin VapB
MPKKTSQAQTDKPQMAKLFKNGSSQAVRLPRAFRFKGDSVRIRREGDSVILDPVMTTKEWFALLDSFNDEPFMPEGRDQPGMPPDRKIFE